MARAARVWKVVGGSESGGILVRRSKDLDSDALPERLSTGAYVMEVGVVDGSRLNYKRINGAGPPRGWVSIRTKDGVLIEATGLTVKEALALNQQERPRRPEAAEIERAEQERQAARLREAEEATRQRALQQQRLRSMSAYATAEALQQCPSRGLEAPEAERAAREAAKAEGCSWEEGSVAAGAAEEEDPHLPPPLETSQLQEALVGSTVVLRSPWGDEECELELVDYGDLLSGDVQAVWATDDVIHVVKSGRVATVVWGEAWDGKLKDWGRIFHGSVRAAWTFDGDLFVVKNGRVAKARLGPDGPIWNGTLHEDGWDIVRGRVQAAWVSDGGFYVVKKRSTGEIQVAKCEWGSHWDGHTEHWPVLGSSCRTAWVHDGFIYIVKDSSST
mmetsp:Transcript_102572/g.319633  ORF Transcript_102572/g.319633 Transcript_102572/m.319633 type:complete len:389 (+) Transcript_102572:34-1200(+)